MAGKFELFKDKKGEFRFRLKSGNGEIVLPSEGYMDRAGALNGIESVKKNAGDAAPFAKKVAASGKHHFVLKAANNQAIGSCEMYESEAACDAGMATVTAHAASASLDDQTAA